VVYLNINFPSIIGSRYTGDFRGQLERSRTSKYKEHEYAQHSRPGETGSLGDFDEYRLYITMKQVDKIIWLRSLEWI
jgi:hypothetical protein